MLPIIAAHKQRLGKAGQAAELLSPCGAGWLITRKPEIRMHANPSFASRSAAEAHLRLRLRLLLRLLRRLLQGPLGPARRRCLGILGQAGTSLLGAVVLICPDLLLRTQWGTC
jgi:hypothetical protein